MARLYRSCFPSFPICGLLAHRKLLIIGLWVPMFTRGRFSRKLFCPSTVMNQSNRVVTKFPQSPRVHCVSANSSADLVFGRRGNNPGTIRNPFYVFSVLCVL
jgi:hypothetical protein